MKQQDMSSSSSNTSGDSLKTSTATSELPSGSSSSSHPSTASSRSNQSGTSMDTEPTQEAVDGPSIDDDDEEELEEKKEQPKVWGRLFSLQSKYFESKDFTKDEYCFGRDTSCDYLVKLKNFKGKTEYFRSVSKRHFKIARQLIGSDHEVFITDLSTNGTFLNGEKLVRNVKQILSNNDEIAFPVPRNKAFVFNDVVQTEKENERFPMALRSKYSVGKLLGSGACGEVRLCYRKGSMDRFAVKILSKKKFSVSTMKASEVGIVRSLNHPCIVTIEEVIESDDTLFIILELVSGGELFDRVVQVKKFDEPTAKLLFYQMLLAVQYLHSKGITHRDLKPENVLLASDDKETVIKITDFGLSRFVPENTLMKTLCGTPNYLAPEVRSNLGLSGYGKKCDCWSLGCILYICLGGYPPFSDDDPSKPMKDQIQNGDYSFPDLHWGHTSAEAKDLIAKFLVVDPNKRISVAEALSHPWLQDDEMKAKVQALLEGDKLKSRSDSTASTDSLPPPASTAPRKRSQDSTFHEEDNGHDTGKKPRLEPEP